MSLFLTVHGIDGTGKTTVTNLLPKSLEPVLSGVRNFSDIEELLDPEDGGALSISERSLRKKIAQSEIIKRVLESGVSVIKDRWAIDVAASNEFKGTLLGDPLSPAIRKPDISVLLTCDDAERMRRIKTRENPTSEDLIPKEPGTRAMFFENYVRDNLPLYCGSLLIIDTTDISPELVVQRVTNEVENHVGV